MNIDPLISVIVPIYNAGSFLENCIDSILHQTYKRLEIILVDDGSTDNSFEICKRYQKIDNRIIIITKENAGVSSARNIGIETASGKYIGFVDSDDWIELNMYELLYKQIVKYNADIAMCGYFKEDNDGKLINKNLMPKKASFSQYEGLEMALSDSYFQGFMCNKLFAASLFTLNDKIRLDENIHIYEDLLCVCQCILKSKTIAFIGDQLYHYISNDSSATKSPFNLQKVTILDAVNKINNICLDKYPQLFRNLNAITVYANLYLLNNIRKSGFYDEKVYKKINTNILNALRESLKSNILSPKIKIYVILIAINPKLYIWIYNLLKSDDYI